MIHIIHDIRRTDRYFLFKGELEKQGMLNNHTIWAATTDRETVNENISESHKRIVRWAKNKGLKEVCIAEDDFYFPSANGFKIFLGNKPKFYDIYLAGVYVGSNKLSKENNIVKRFSGLHFYIIHSRFYDFFLETDFKHGIDNALGDLAIQGYGKFEVCYPMTAIQHETPSDNNKGEIYKIDSYFKKDMVFGL